MRPVARVRAHAADRPAPRRVVPPQGPGPSKLSYRASRAWAQAWVRSAVQVYLPIALVAAMALGVVATDRLRLAIRQDIEAVLDSIALRPEFTVKSVAVSGGSPALEARVVALLSQLEGRSSLHLDLGALREELKSIGAVRDATLQVDGTGVLRVALAERIPVALWRDPEDVLWTVDREGVLVGFVPRRADRPDLLLLRGLGAPPRVEEALEIAAAAPALRERTRAFTLVALRRWDLVLDRDMTVKLPAESPERALKGAMGLHHGEQLFERDLVTVDLRDPSRPVLRLSPRAAEEMVLRRAADLVLGEDT